MKLSKFNIKNSVIGAMGSFVNIGSNMVNSMNISGGGISMSTSGNHTTLVINGRKYEIESGNVSIIGKDVYVNGEKYDLDDPDLKTATSRTEINITIEGNANEIECNGSVSVAGNVNGNIDCNGSITVVGSVDADIDVNGSATIKGDMKGDIDAGGSVTIMGNHEGDIDAGGSVIMKR